MSASDLYERMLADIERTGRSILNIFPTEAGGDSFAYSVGNSIKDLPELLVINMRPDDATWLLNTLSEEMIKRGCKLGDGELVDLGGPCPVCAIDAADSVKALYTIQAGNLLEDDYSVMQVILPDPIGKFPWDEGCAEPYALAKIFRRLAS